MYFFKKYSNFFFTGFERSDDEEVPEDMHQGQSAHESPENQYAK
jgi:hypothetical protein